MNWRIFSAEHTWDPSGLVEGQYAYPLLNDLLHVIGSVARRTRVDRESLAAMTDAQDQNPQWIVRLTPRKGIEVESLLQMSLGLDVWERKRDPDVLVVAANDNQLSELERRRLASVERLYTVEEYVSEFGSRPGDQRGAQETNEEESQR